MWTDLAHDVAELFADTRLDLRELDAFLVIRRPTSAEESRSYRAARTSPERAHDKRVQARRDARRWASMTLAQREDYNRRRRERYAAKKGPRA